MNENALEKKYYYFLIFRDMMLKSSKRKSISWILAKSSKFKGIPMNSLAYSLSLSRSE